jgi:hypothetical protein
VPLFFFSCFITTKKVISPQEVSVLHFHKQYDIVLDLDNPPKNICYQYRLWEDSTGDIIFKTISGTNLNLYTINLSQNKIIDSICLKTTRHKQMIDNFLQISKDTILTAFNTSYTGGYHNWALSMITRHGETPKYYSLHKFPVRMYPDSIEIDIKNLHYVNYRYFSLVSRRNKIFVPLLRWNHQSDHSRDHLIGVLPADTSLPVGYLPVFLPKLSKGYSWGAEQTMPHGTWDGKDVFYTFFSGYPFLFKYNILLQELTKIPVHFNSIDTFIPYKKNETDIMDDPYHSALKSLIIDEKNHRLWLSARVGCKKNDSPSCAQFFNFVYSVLMLDTLGNIMGEGVIPKGYFPNMIPYKDGYLMFKLQEKKITFTYFTYSASKESSTVLQDDINSRRAQLNQQNARLPLNKAIRAYLNEAMGKDNSKRYQKFIIIPETSCFACQPLYANMIKTYTPQILQKNIAVVLQFSPESAKQFIEIINLEDDTTWNESTNSLQIYKDTLQLQEDYFDPWINMHYIEFDNKDKIITQRQVNPNDIENFIKFLAK